MRLVTTALLALTIAACGGAAPTTPAAPGQTTVHTADATPEPTASPTDSPTATLGPTEAPTAPLDASANPLDDVPEGFTSYVDPQARFTIALPDGWTGGSLAEEFRAFEGMSPIGTVEMYIGFESGGLAGETLGESIRDVQAGLEDLYSTEGTISEVTLPAGPAGRFEISYEVIPGREQTLVIYQLADGIDEWGLSFTMEGAVVDPVVEQIAETFALSSQP